MAHAERQRAAEPHRLGSERFLSSARPSIHQRASLLLDVHALPVQSVRLESSAHLGCDLECRPCGPQLRLARPRWPMRSRSLTMTKLGLVLAMGLPLAGSAVTGTLDPPGPPAPSMVTLQQIYDRIGVAAPVAKTGVTACFGAAGTAIPCAGTGQDGEFAAGTSASPRFTVVGDGTVKDKLTGLVWVQNPG